jgi:diacylglycerol kinase family enzyme
LPAGNSNLLARYFGISKDPAVVCQTICGGTTIQVDAGLANGRVFLLMAGCGFDAAVVQRVHQQRAGHVSDRKYVKAILASMWSYPYAEIQVHWSDHGAEAAMPPGSARWWFAFNLPCYAGGLSLAPQADGFDGLLDVLGLRRGGSFCGLGYLAAVLAGQHHRLPSCTLRRASRLRLTSAVAVPYQLDGDPGGNLPLELQVLPARLTLVIPEATAKKRFRNKQ